MVHDRRCIAKVTPAFHLITFSAERCAMSAPTVKVLVAAYTAARWFCNFFGARKVCRLHYLSFQRLESLRRPLTFTYCS